MINIDKELILNKLENIDDLLYAIEDIYEDELLNKIIRNIRLEKDIIIKECKGLNKKKTDKIKLASVSFENGKRTYDYILNNESYEAGDYVEVEVGAYGHKEEAKIVKIKEVDKTYIESKSFSYKEIN